MVESNMQSCTLPIASAPYDVAIHQLPQTAAHTQAAVCGNWAPGAKSAKIHEPDKKRTAHCSSALAGLRATDTEPNKESNKTHCSSNNLPACKQRQQPLTSCPMTPQHSTALCGVAEPVQQHGELLH
jgi:hypothetical protein